MTVMQSRGRFSRRQETGCTGRSQAARWRAAGLTRVPGRALPHRPAGCHKPGADRCSVPFKRPAPPQPKELLDGFCTEPRQEQGIALNSNGLILFLRLADIEWLQAVDQGVELHVGQRTHLLRASLAAVTAKLPPDRFLLIDRSTLVNIAQIMGLKPASHGGYDVLLRNGTRLHRNTDSEAPRLRSFDPPPDAIGKPALRKPRLSRWDE